MLTQQEFETILDDTSKVIQGDIEWQEDEDHSPSVEFRVEIVSSAGWPLFVKGSYNRDVKALTFAIIFQRSARIYALDLGKKHRNPDGIEVGEKHKHRWSERFRDKEAYEPPDITATTDRPLDVWQQFCVEAKIQHLGAMKPPVERRLFDA